MKLKDIKNQFDQREIRPSEGSWDQLAERLDNTEKKASINWLYYAGATAAILVMILLVFPLSDQPDPALKREIVTDEDTNQRKDDAPVEDVIKSDNNNLTDSVDEGFALRENSTDVQPSISDSMLTQNNNLIIKRQPVDQILLGDQNISAVPVELPILTNPVAVPEMHAMDEADLLLTEAMQELDSSLQYQYYVNPERLLQEIEIDIAMEKDRKVESRILRGLELTVMEIYSTVRGNQ